MPDLNPLVAAYMRGAPQANGEVVNSRPVLDRKDPLRTARIFVQAHYQTDAVRTLHHHRGDFYAWTGSHYAEASDAEIRARMYELLDGADVATKDGTERSGRTPRASTKRLTPCAP